jgi:hypothetical protein
MQYSLTIFKSIFDNSTHRKMTFKNWSDVEKLFLDLSKQDGYKPKKGEFKEGSPLISPAVYEEDAKRRNVNVLGWGSWAALDIDDYDCSFEEVIKNFENIRHILYNSSSSTEEKPKFRVVLPFKRFIKADEIKHLWYALNSEFNSFADPQTKDLSRMYYVPAKYPGAYSFFKYNEEAEMIDVDTLMRKHPFVVPKDNSFRSQLSEDMKEKLFKYRKNQLKNTDITWSSYKDCPFVNSQLVNEYRFISETGWYAKLYSIMVSIAGNAIYKGYPITTNEIVNLAKEIDADTGCWYKTRPLNVEAERALTFALQNA